MCALDRALDVRDRSPATCLPTILGPRRIAYFSKLPKNRRVAVELWGRTPAVGDTDERFCGSHKLFRPDGSFMPLDQCPMGEILNRKVTEARDEEVLVEQPDGSRVVVIVNIRTPGKQRWRTTGDINCFYEITEHKQGEAKLRESEERFRTLFESAPMAVFVCDRNAVIRNYNQHAVELWGREPVRSMRFLSRHSSINLRTSGSTQV